MRPLLVMDGDSFAHRAFHALPKTLRRDDGGPANTLIGFTSMLLRLWKAERPRAVVVAWDTIGVPTYRNELLPTYQSGREFDPEIVDQLALLPALISSTMKPHCTKKFSVIALSVSRMRRVIMWLAE